MPPANRPEKALETVRITLGVLTLLVLPLAWQAWRNHDELIPMVPAVGGFPQLPIGLDILLPILLMALAAASLLPQLKSHSPNALRGVHLGIAALIAFGCFEDLNRCHPWMYQIAFMHLFFAVLPSERNPKGLHFALAFMITGIYFWSGFHKFNPEYPRWVLPWLLGPFGYPEDEPMAGIAYVTAFLEAAFAVLLWFPALRKWGLAGLVAMHLFILISIGPLGHNWNPVVWPWNLLMPYWAWLLLVRNRPALPDWKGFEVKAVAGIALLIFGILPGLHTLGAVNGYLSFSLYSGKVAEATIFLPADRIFDMPKASRAYGDVKGDMAYISVAGWTIETLGISPFPSGHYYRQTYRVLCQRYPALAESYMVIKSYQGNEAQKYSVKCGE